MKAPSALQTACYINWQLCLLRMHRADPATGTAMRLVAAFQKNRERLNRGSRVSGLADKRQKQR